MTRLLETPAGVKLGALEIVRDGGARNFVLEIRGQYFHGFVIRRGVIVHGFVDQCPHMNVPLSQKLDDYLTPSGDHIVCSWHGALFRIENGFCVGGPCQGQSLRAWPVANIDGSIVTI